MKDNPRGGILKERVELWQSLADYQKGLDFFNSRRFEEALPPLKDCLEKDPDFSAARLLLGKTLRLLACYRDSLKQFERYLKNCPDDPEGLDEAADVALYEGETETSIRLSSHLFELQPTDEKNLCRLILVLYQREGLKSALRMIHQVLKRHPTWILGFNYLAKLNELQGDYIAAEKAYASVLELDPSQDETLVDLRRIWRGETSQQDRLKESYSVLFVQEAYRLAEMDPTAAILKVLESWQLLFPHQQEILEILVTIYRTLKQSSHALQVIERVPNHLITLNTLLLKAEIYETTGEYEQAFDLYRALSVQYPDNRQVWLGVARTSTIQVDKHRAFHALEEGLKHFPEMSDLWYSHSILLKDMGNLAAVLQSLARALKINPHHTPALLALGQEHLARGNYKDAVMCFSHLLAQDLEHVDALRGLAIAHTQLNHWEDSVKSWKTLLRLVPGDSQAMRVLSHIEGSIRNNRSIPKANRKDALP